MATDLMSDKHKQKLSQNLDKFIENLSIKAVMTLVRSEGVLIPCDVDEIAHKQTDLEKIGYLVDSLQKRPDCEYMKFVNILEKTGHPHLAKLLDELEPPNGNSAELEPIFSFVANRNCSFCSPDKSHYLRPAKCDV